MRRKPGQLLPLEISICAAALTLLERGTTRFHGYELAKHLQAVSDARLLTAYGTLYRALTRLEEMGLLESKWEDPEVPARENRPGRRLYSLTAKGEETARTQRAAQGARPAARDNRRLRPA